LMASHALQQWINAASKISDLTTKIRDNNRNPGHSGNSLIARYMHEQELESAVERFYKKHGPVLTEYAVILNDYLQMGGAREELQKDMETLRQVMNTEKEVERQTKRDFLDEEIKAAQATYLKKLQDKKKLLKAKLGIRSEDMLDEACERYRLEPNYMSNRPIDEMWVFENLRAQVQNLMDAEYDKRPYNPDNMSWEQASYQLTEAIMLDKGIKLSSVRDLYLYEEYQVPTLSSRCMGYTDYFTLQNLMPFHPQATSRYLERVKMMPFSELIDSSWAMDDRHDRELKEFVSELDNPRSSYHQLVPRFDDEDGATARLRHEIYIKTCAQQLGLKLPAEFVSRQRVVIAELKNEMRDNGSFNHVKMAEREAQEKCQDFFASDLIQSIEQLGQRLVSAYIGKLLKVQDDPNDVQEDFSSSKKEVGVSAPVLAIEHKPEIPLQGVISVSADGHSHQPS